MNLVCACYRNVAPNSEALLKLYRAADIFALPTRADCYSLVCMEALASGLPIVATKVGGIPDILRDGKTGHLARRRRRGVRSVTPSSRWFTTPVRRREMGRNSGADAVRPLRLARKRAQAVRVRAARAVEAARSPTRLAGAL